MHEKHSQNDTPLRSSQPRPVGAQLETPASEADPFRAVVMEPTRAFPLIRGASGDRSHASALLHRCRRGTFGHAAERLHLSQSPLSHQVREREREIGVELVDRSHHVVGLADAGQVFLRSVRTTSPTFGPNAASRSSDRQRLSVLASSARRGAIKALMVHEKRPGEPNTDLPDRSKRSVRSYRTPR